MKTINANELLAYAEKGKIIYCDYETQSPVNLKDEGSQVYIRSPLTRIMSGVYYVHGKVLAWINPDACPAAYIAELKQRVANVQIYCGNDPVEPIKQYLKKGYVICAHNAELFDYPLAVAKCNSKQLNDATWIDTIHFCRLAGIPAGLGKALEYIGHTGKLDNEPMLMLSKAKATYTGCTYPIGTPALWEKMLRYNIDDTIKLQTLMNELATYELYDADNIQKHCTINARGINIDREYTKHLRRLWEETKNNSGDEIAEITKGKLKSYRDSSGVLKHDVASPAKVKTYLMELGFFLPNNSLNSQTVNQIIAHPERYTDGLADETAESILAILVLRQNVTRSTIGKLERILRETDETGTAYNWARYHGAHTGRFSGQGIQPHNFQRGVKLKNEPTYNDLVSMRHTITFNTLKTSSINNTDIEKGKRVSVSDVLGTLTRNVIIPKKGKKFIISDFSQIEGRGTAWVANCNSMLAIYADATKDIYCDMATKLFGRLITPKDELERFIGKQIVLGCGYGMSATKFELMCKVYNVDLVRAGVTAAQCVDSFRKSYPEIVKCWRDTGNAAMNAIRHPGYVYNAAKCQFQCKRNALEITLPSGRKIRYPDVKIVKLPSLWAPNELTDQITYRGVYGFDKKLYGGLLVENIVQGISRDILCAKMNDYPNCPVVMHVHDEIIWECATRNVSARFNKIMKDMSTPPDWAFDFPLGCDGHTSIVYTKEKLKGEKHLAALAGKLLSV